MDPASVNIEKEPDIVGRIQFLSLREIEALERSIDNIAMGTLLRSSSHGALCMRCGVSIQACGNPMV